MKYKCLECEADIGNLINYDTLTDDYIECPNCKNKMKVCYDETWDGEEEGQIWWVEPYIKDY